MTPLKLFLIFFYLSMSMKGQNVVCLPPNEYNPPIVVNQIKNTGDKLLEHTKLTPYLEKEAVQLIVFIDSLIPYSKYARHKPILLNRGFRIFLTNNSSRTIQLLPAFVKVSRQVHYKGAWRDAVAHRSQSFPICGNDSNLWRYTDFLQNSYFSFLAPCIDGDTILSTRFVAKITDNGIYSLIVSNVFEASFDTILIAKPISKS